MERFFEILMASVMCAVILSPVVFAMVVATAVAGLFAGVCQPVTDPIEKLIAQAGECVSYPLEMIPLYSAIRKRFGSVKNILFMGFVIGFLIWHYQSLSNVEILFENISVLFPGSALEQIASYGSYDGTLDISSFFVEPESYLRTIIFSCVTGVFMHMGCETKAKEARVSIPVKVLYTMLITLFSAIVLGKIPDDVFRISIPEISLDFTSAGMAAGDSQIQVTLAQLQEFGGVLLEKLVTIVPTLVALYFLAHSISGFAVSFLGGFIAIFALGIGWPEALADVGSPDAVYLLLYVLFLGETVALLFSELLSLMMKAVIEIGRELFLYYNIVSLLISYFFYPAFAVVVAAVISLCVNGFDLALFGFALVCLLVFSLAMFVGYFVSRRTMKDGSKIDGAFYATAMVFNFPIWIIYIALFVVPQNG